MPLPNSKLQEVGIFHLLFGCSLWKTKKKKKNVNFCFWFDACRRRRKSSLGWPGRPADGASRWGGWRGRMHQECCRLLSRRAAAPPAGDPLHSWTHPQRQRVILTPTQTLMCERTARFYIYWNERQQCLARVSTPLWLYLLFFFFLRFVMFDVVNQQKVVHEFKVEKNLISVESIFPAPPLSDPHQIKSTSVIVLSSDSKLDSGIDFD